MRNKILILTDSFLPLQEPTGFVYEQLAGHWEFEVKKYEITRSESWFGKKLFPALLGLSQDLASFKLNLTQQTAQFLLEKYFKKEVGELLEQLRSFQPPMVVVFDPITAILVSLCKKRGLYLGKTAAVLFGLNLNSNWSLPELDFYVVQNDYLAQSLKAAGVNESKIGVCNNLLELSLKTYEEIIASLKLLTTMPTLLLVSDIDSAEVVETVTKILRSPQSTQLLVVTTNLDLAHTLAKVSAPARKPLRIFVSREKMDLLMSVSKACMLSPKEDIALVHAAARKLPIIVMNFGENKDELLDELQKNQMVVFGRIPAEVVFHVEAVLLNKPLTDVQKARKLLAVSESGKGLVELFDGLKPNPEPKIQSYQDKEQ